MEERADRVEQLRSQERLTMQQRIEAFFRQSGGPNNPQIDRFMEKHLRYGADHGDYGHKETIEDAFQDAVLEDKSLLTLYELYMRWRSQRREEEHRESGKLEERIARLEEEVRSLREVIERGADQDTKPR
ncbi:hypothetical protein [Rubrobacter calidifluminis]|uniref:hypothetical protein n=1 Tax=Rubrobacter calidifluminis TaxID=1392640 RepID=UPI00235DF794|nr:hypothetical protein [Rubrobacter calidifluminis]